VRPILKDVQVVTEPLAPIIKILTQPIPVISDLSGHPTTLLDLAQQFGGKKFNRGMIDAIIAVINVVNSIPTDGSTIAINFGDFVVGDGSGSNDLRNSSNKLANTDTTGNDKNFDLDKEVANPSGQITTPGAGSGGGGGPNQTAPTAPAKGFLSKLPALPSVNMALLTNTLTLFARDVGDAVTSL